MKTRSFGKAIKYWDEDQKDYERMQDEDVERMYPGYKERGAVSPIA